MVKLSDDGADIGLEQAGSEHEQHEAGVEEREAGSGEAELAGRNQDAAVEHGAALAGDAVGHPSTREAQQVDHGGVEAVDRAGLGDAEAEAAAGRGGGHEQDEEGAHAVIAEALPHFGEEQGRQPAGVAEKATVVAGGV